MVSQVRRIAEAGVIMESLKGEWKQFASKDRVQSFIIIMLLFTILYLTNNIPVELFEKISTMSIIGVFGADAADNITNLRRN